MTGIVETDVLVVGGGLTGLAAAAFLARHGVRVLLAERHPGTSTHPKARLVNVRSMELYRALGVEGAVRAAGEPNAGFVLADTLASEHEAWIPPPPDEAPGGDLSPCRPYSCDQDRIEPILRARAVELGADVRFATTATAVVDRGDRVTATLDGAGAATVHARYAIAADGAHSPLRDRLGIGRHGEPVPGTAVSVLFRADLGPALRGRRVDALLARAAEAFLFARGNPAERRWQLGTYLRPGWDPRRIDAYVRDVIRAAAGLPDLDPFVEGVQTWTSGAYVADRFRSGRVFLVGDAAHVMPPYGGFGGNTGVQDAHNLTWKLAAVCGGDAPDALLDTYESERAPIAELTVGQALLRSRKTPGQPPPPTRSTPPRSSSASATRRATAPGPAWSRTPPTRPGGPGPARRTSSSPTGAACSTCSTRPPSPRCTTPPRAGRHGRTGCARSGGNRSPGGTGSGGRRCTAAEP